GFKHPHPFALDIGADRAADIGAFVPDEAGLAEGVVDDVDGAFDIPFAVGVLDAEDKGAVIFFGDQVGIEGGTEVADVHIAGRAGSDPGPDGFGGCVHRFRSFPVCRLSLVLYPLWGGLSRFIAAPAMEIHFRALISSKRERTLRRPAFHSRSRYFE